MISGDLLDTFLNLWTFVFIGFAGWLLWRKLPERDDSGQD